MTLATSSPTAGTYSDIDYHSGFIFSNGQAGECASSIDVPTVCSVDFSLMSDTASEFEMSLWKAQECTNAAAVLVAQGTISAATNTAGMC